MNFTPLATGEKGGGAALSSEARGMAIEGLSKRSTLGGCRIMGAG
jgi:hypothetical protein